MRLLVFVAVCLPFYFDGNNASSVSPSSRSATSYGRIKTVEKPYNHCVSRRSTDANLSDAAACEGSLINKTYVSIQPNPMATQKLKSILQSTSAQLVFFYFNLVAGNKIFHPGACPKDGKSAIDAKTPLAWVFVRQPSPGSIFNGHSFARAYLTFPKSYPRIYSLGILDGKYVEDLNHAVYGMDAVVDAAGGCWESFDLGSRSKQFFDAVQQFFKELVNNTGIESSWNICFSNPVTSGLTVTIADVDISETPAYFCKQRDGTLSKLERNTAYVVIAMICWIGIIYLLEFQGNLVKTFALRVFKWGTCDEVHLTVRSEDGNVKSTLRLRDRFFSDNHLPVDVSIGGIFCIEAFLGRTVARWLKAFLVPTVFVALYTLFPIYITCYLFAPQEEGNSTDDTIRHVRYADTFGEPTCEHASAFIEIAVMFSVPPVILLPWLILQNPSKFHEAGKLSSEVAGELPWTSLRSLAVIPFSTFKAIPQWLSLSLPTWLGLNMIKYSKQMLMFICAALTFWFMLRFIPYTTTEGTLKSNIVLGIPPAGFVWLRLNKINHFKQMWMFIGIALSYWFMLQVIRDTTTEGTLKSNIVLAIYPAGFVWLCLNEINYFKQMLMFICIALSYWFMLQVITYTTTEGILKSNIVLGIPLAGFVWYYVWLHSDVYEDRKLSRRAETPTQENNEEKRQNDRARYCARVIILTILNVAFIAIFIQAAFIVALQIVTFALLTGFAVWLNYPEGTMFFFTWLYAFIHHYQKVSNYYYTPLQAVWKVHITALRKMVLIGNDRPATVGRPGMVDLLSFDLELSETTNQVDWKLFLSEAEKTYYVTCLDLLGKLCPPWLSCDCSNELSKLQSVLRIVYLRKLFQSVIVFIALLPYFLLLIEFNTLWDQPGVNPKETSTLLIQYLVFPPLAYYCSTYNNLNIGKFDEEQIAEVIKSRLRVNMDIARRAEGGTTPIASSASFSRESDSSTTAQTALHRKVNIPPVGHAVSEGWKQACPFDLDK